MDKLAPFLLSLHDVAWDSVGACEEVLRFLDSCGAPAPALAVIPWTPGPEEAGQFGAWLRRQKERGSDLLCHGYHHRADPALDRSLAGRIALRLTGKEAELAGLNQAQTRQVLEQALRAWTALCVGPALGFVAPTWYGNPWLRSECAYIGFPLLEERLALRSADGLHVWTSLPISLAGTGAFGRMLPRLISSVPALIPHRGVRLVLHPSDFVGPGAVSVGKLVRSLAGHLAHGRWADVLFAPSKETG